MRSSLSIITLGAFAHNVQAVLVANNSPCQTNCGNVLDATTDDQLSCDDASYGTTAGKVFQSCVTCESTSPYVTTERNQTVSDLQAMLYNMRYAAARCLFKIDTGVCSTLHACEPLKTALEYGNLSSTVTPYGYCSAWSDYNLEKCTECLELEGNHITRNFISILSGACRLQTQPSQTIPIEGNIFSTDLANVTDPSPTAAVRVHNQVGPLSYASLAGVVIGGVAFLLVLLGCGVVVNGKRRRKNYLRRREEQMKNWPGPPAAGEMFETPLSQRPLRGGWADSPVSATTADGIPPFPRYFSPYASQYNSPVSAVEGHGSMPWQAGPIEKANTIGVALSPDHDKPESPWGDRKGKDKVDASTDGYELQEGVNSAGGYGSSVPPPPPIPSDAPMLNHPGYGRQGQMYQRQTPSPPS